MFVEQGQIRRLWFRATTEREGRAFCIKFNAGYEGMARSPEVEIKPLPAAYDVKTSCALLGGISEATLYREIKDGKLDRLPDTRRVLVTRESLERRKKWRLER